MIRPLAHDSACTITHDQAYSADSKQHWRNHDRLRE